MILNSSVLETKKAYICIFFVQHWFIQTLIKKTEIVADEKLHQK